MGQHTGLRLDVLQHELVLLKSLETVNGLGKHPPPFIYILIFLNISFLHRQYNGKPNPDPVHTVTHTLVQRAPRSGDPCHMVSMDTCRPDPRAPHRLSYSEHPLRHFGNQTASS